MNQVNLIVTEEVLEEQRLLALDSYDVLDTPPEEAFDRLTRLVRSALDVPVAFVSLVDRDRQWFKSALGLSVSETPRDIAFCSRAIERDEPLVVPDARKDVRFKNNPLVTGSPYVVFYAGVPLVTPEGFRIGTLCAVDHEPRAMTPKQLDMLQDLARLVLDQTELRRIATVDSLTGAMSRRRFDIECEREIKRLQRYGGDLSCILLDLDHFKQINDDHGHGAGDLILQRVVSSCKLALRDTDVLARYGGEEFAVLLPQTSQDAARDVAERLRRIVESLETTFGNRSLKVTASFGVAGFRPEDQDARPFMQRCDDALY